MMIKYEVICLATCLTIQVIIMSKMVHFSNFLLMTAKD